MNTLKLTFPVFLESNKGNLLFSVSGLFIFMRANDMLCLWERKEKFFLILQLGRAEQSAANFIPMHLISLQWHSGFHIFSDGAVYWCCVAAAEIGTVILLIVLITHALHSI